jgi:KaiC/GvpD/RAD55 family RecA-like ATPase
MTETKPIQNSINDVELREAFFRFYKIGVPQLEALFGNLLIDEGLECGFKIPSAVLISAPAGSGKTRGCLRIIHKFCENYGKDRGLYVSSEMDETFIKYYSEQMGAKDFLVKSTKSAETISHMIRLNHALAENESQKIRMVIIDSWSSMNFPKGMSIDQKAEYFVDLAHSLDICIIMLMQQTKAGTMAGSNKVVHAVDAVIAIERGDEDFYGAKNVRVFSIDKKNRLAQDTSIKAAFALVGGSFDFSNPLAIKEEDVVESTKQHKMAQRKEKLLSKLLEVFDASPYNGKFETVDLPSVAALIDELNGDVPKLERCLRTLESNGKINIYGRASTKIWKKIA